MIDVAAELLELAEDLDEAIAEAHLELAEAKLVDPAGHLRRAVWLDACEQDAAGLVRAGFLGDLSRVPAVLDAGEHLAEEVEQVVARWHAESFGAPSPPPRPAPPRPGPGGFPVPVAYSRG